MARLIGNRPQLLGVDERRFYEFVMNEMPDYIFAIFNASFILVPDENDEKEILVKYVQTDKSGEPDYDDLGIPQDEFIEAAHSGRVFSCDAILLIPHMGCFIMDIYSAGALRRENDGYVMAQRMGERRVNLDARRQKEIRKRMLVRKYFKQKFNYMPLVYEVACYPNINVDSLGADNLPFDPNHAMFMNDLRDETGFLSKLYGMMLYARKELKDQQWRMFDDLTDHDTSYIFRSWNKDVPPPVRPDSPPVIFMSHSTKNSMRAQEIKEQLEERGVFVWRSPEDVPISEHYLVIEMQAIADCTAFLILMSNASQISDEVRIEFEEAVRLKKRIIPLLIEDFEMNDYYKFGLTKYQYRELIEDRAAVYDEIVSVVSKQETGRQ